jgi:branched-chain amino acid transport system permease protein
MRSGPPPAPGRNGVVSETACLDPVRGMILFIEQLLNGLQYGVMLFLLAAGLTLIFGIMGVINLAHGSLYMVGAYAGVYVAGLTGSFWLGLPAALAGAALTGLLIEAVVIRRLYARDHLDQVLATFALILIFNELITIGFGRQPVFTPMPVALLRARSSCCPACSTRPTGC